MAPSSARRPSGIWGRLLPVDTLRYQGPRWAAALLVAVNVAGTVRSLIHVFAPDSGAGTIASMSTSGSDGANVVDLLAQWGGAQLLEAILIWIVLARYRGLVPLMLAVVTLEQALRIGIGSAKPLVTEHTPPGAVSWILLPVLAVALVGSLTLRRRADSGSSESDRPDRPVLRSADGRPAA